jgi:hypothetical protein
MPSTDADSSATLPAKGYSVTQLKNYILRQMGHPIWEVELTSQHILDCIQDSLNKYSVWRPQVKAGSVPMQSGQTAYLTGVDVGFGVAQVDFVDPTPSPTEIFYGNLITPAPLMRTGLDEYDTFQRWRKVWQRVTSVKPDWFYDDMQEILFIYNPIERYHAGVICHVPHTQTEKLPLIGAMWVKEYALEKSRYLYGEVMSKFDGAIPGPIKDLQLDKGKRERAEAKIKELEDKLFGMQSSAPLSID